MGKLYSLLQFFGSGGIINMRNTLYWLVQTLGYWSIVFFFIPPKTLKQLLPFGLVGGFLYTLIVQIMAVAVFQKWRFYPDFLTILGIPLFFIISWFGVTLTFGYLLLRFSKYQVVLVLLFALIATQMNYSAIKAGMTNLIGWSLLDTFMFGLFSHVLNLYLLKLMLKRDELGSPQP